MFMIKLTRAFLVVVLLASLAFHEIYSSPVPEQSPARMRYVMLAVAYRQQIQEKIEAPSLVTADLPNSLFSMWADIPGRLHEVMMSIWLVPCGDLALESVPLQL